MNRLFALAATTAAVGFAEADLRAQSAADSASVTAFSGRWFRDEIRRPVASDATGWEVTFRMWSDNR